MKVLVRNQPLAISVIDSDLIESVHTGRPLRRHRVTVITPGEGHYLNGINQCVIDMQDGSGPSVFGLEVKMSSFTQGSNRTTYDLLLTEKEAHMLEQLLVDGIEIETYRYKEEASSSGILTIKARAQVSPELREQLYAIRSRRGYVPVVRRGIQDDPRFMRFGAIYWSRDGDRFKMDFTIVDKAYDDDPTGSFTMLLNRTDPVVAEASTMSAEILSELVRVGVLDDATADGIRDRAAKSIAGPHKIYGLENVDDLKFE